MKVTLISYTKDAAELLIFTKSTRLTLSPGLLEDIRAWPEERKLKELEYMSCTIPSSWEFCDYVFMVEGVSRAYTHQQVRTRAASYAQQTMRVLNVGAFDYVYTQKNTESAFAMHRIDACLAEIKRCYDELVESGQPVEDARGILTTNIATNIICKFNLRTFVDLAKSRTGGRTQSEYQSIINAMCDEVLKVHPWADKFLFKRGRDYFKEIEDFAQEKFPDLKERGELLKIIDQMRKS